MSEADIRPVKFWTAYVPSGEGSGLREIDWVEYARRGEAKYTTTPMRIKDAERNSQIWPTLEKFYRAWKDGKKIVDNGTPLDAWVGLSAEQIEVLKFHDCHSLEDLAALTDAHRSKIGLPGLNGIQQGAARFLTGLSGNKVEVALAEKDQQIAALQAQMEQMAEMIASKMDADEEPKRGPGRPRKDA